MSNTEALIEEVKSDLSKYDDAGLLDRSSMLRDITLGLKRFGNDVMEIHETLVEVVEGEAKLPDNFKALYFAYECEPAGYKTSPDVEEHSLQQSYFYTEKTERSREWNECDDCCENIKETTIKENLYFKQNKIAERHYRKPRLLTLGKSFVRSACHKQCRNRVVRDNPNEIVIMGTTLQANFSSGHVYMQYYGLPVNENGTVEIPETFNGHLEEYLEYRVKRKSAERLMGNNDAVALSNLYGVYKGQEDVLLRKASNELKMGKLGKKFKNRWSRLNKLESAQYESPLTRHR